MKVIINGQEKEISNDQYLKTLVQEFCKDSLNVIAELNGRIIKNPQWCEIPIAEGDRVEFVNIVGGG